MNDEERDDQPTSFITRREDGAFVVTLQFVLHLDFIVDQAAEKAANRVISDITAALYRKAIQ
jgi:hypothetical protein